ncbi:MAG TPA: type II toxin-antitoxin system RelE/ParE family toxin [Bacteroidales bacterium]|nr:type II toxin-antitoxin system RelE/ParE family toxin [Bacteroidales bacterium]HPI85511.1 type II toxin-antitoxin system RelE/ParE family toxin [Bacteroidales bacterium]HPM92627.1 type II toxin-antitoxin system RelE/ParE family toxin [Bacteroidales bacterium]
MIKYRLTNEAVKDLEEIWSYTCNKWSVGQADRYYHLIMEEIEFIASNPLSGKSVDYVKQGYRSAKVKSHLVFYHMTDENNILVVRILHQRMDIEDRIKIEK